MNKNLCRYFTLPVDAKAVFEMAKKTLPRGSRVLEPFAGRLALPEADSEKYFNWTTNDIVPCQGLDHVGDYEDIPGQYDAVISNPPFKQRTTDVIEIINKLGDLYSKDLFLILPCQMLRMDNMYLLHIYRWLVVDWQKTKNRFYCEDEKRSKMVRAVILHLKKSPIKIYQKVTSPHIVPCPWQIADFCFAKKATDAGRLVHKMYRYEKFGVKINNDNFKKFILENHSELSDFCHRYCIERSANMYRINNHEELNFMIISFYLQKNPRLIWHGFYFKAAKEILTAPVLGHQ